MQTKTHKTRITYVVCVFFFCLAGVFQTYDSLLPDFWHALFSLSAHTILISLVVVWGVSLVHRTVRKDLRAEFLAVAYLILFFLVARMIKYGLVRDTDTLSRYLWYAYYVPQMLIPPTLLLAAVSLDNKRGRTLVKPWYLLYVPAGVLLLLIFTNDLHEWAFALHFTSGFSYEHKPVFYIALTWEIVVTLASLILLVVKCSVSDCRRKAWIPVATFAVCTLVAILCFLTDSSAFKIPELLCFTIIVMIESCIAIGLIPSNAEYAKYFHRSAYSAFITDEGFHVIYSSERAIPVEKPLLKQATKGPVMIDENTRLSAERIHGGWTFRTEDLTKINEINAALAETNERLSEENDIIEAENELKEQRAILASKNKLYAKTEEVTREELKRLDELLSDMYCNRPKTDEDYVSKMQFACLLAAYIKRRSNLVMLAEKYQSINASELSLALKESLDYLSLMGAECFCDCTVTDKIDGHQAGIFYDFFEDCTAGSDCLPSAVILRLLKRGPNIVLRLESDRGGEALAAKIKAKYSGYDVAAETDDDTFYASLSLRPGGAV